MTHQPAERAARGERSLADALTGAAAAPAALAALGGAPSDGDFRLLADHLPALCWIARGDGYIVWYNRRWHAYCGGAPDAMEGWGWQAAHDPETLPRVLQGWAASIAQARPFEMVFPLRGADGLFRPFLTRISPLLDAQGQVVRWFGVNTEIGAQLAAERALGESQGMYEVLTNAMPQMVWSTRPDGRADYFSRQWYAFTGMPPGATDGAAWGDLLHPDDRERAQAQWEHSVATGEAYEVEYRMRHHSGEHRWTLARALPARDSGGAIVRWIGTCTDVHAGKSAAEGADLLSHELSHRIKNIFAIIAGLIALSARRDPAARPFARDLAERVAALGRAHEFARPHSEGAPPDAGAVTLRGLLAQLFDPYEFEGQTRIRVEGDDAPVDDKGATPLGLLFHELATNAAKHGALSWPQGVVTLRIHLEGGHAILTWRETGGPRVAGAPAHEGFGNRLAALSVEQQMGGRLVRNWRPEGLELRVEVALSRLVRS